MDAWSRQQCEEGNYESINTGDILKARSLYKKQAFSNISKKKDFVGLIE